ncbi:MAG: hypothetical protein ACRDEA_16925 [Microcystaceae cyanobacterium]
MEKVIVMVDSSRFQNTITEPTDSITHRTEAEESGNSRQSLELKKKIEENHNNFFKVFLDIIEDAVTLTIETTVKDAGDSEEKLLTEISLLEGDIKNEIGSKFVTDESYEKVRIFHQEQVAKGEEIIKKNLESLHDLINYLIDVYKKNKNKDVS